MKKSEIDITLRVNEFTITMSTAPDPEHRDIQPGAMTGTSQEICEEFYNALNFLHGNKLRSVLASAATHAFAHTAQSYGYHHGIYVKETLSDGTEKCFFFGPDQRQVSIN